MDIPDCQYCGNAAELVTGKEIHPHDLRPEIGARKFYRCLPCHAYVGCHPRSELPLGSLANSKLRRLRGRVHDVLDPLWKSGLMTRIEVYDWLTYELDLYRFECAVAMFNEQQCKEAILICKNKREELKCKM